MDILNVILNKDEECQSSTASNVVRTEHELVASNNARTQHEAVASNSVRTQHEAIK